MFPLLSTSQISFVYCLLCPERTLNIFSYFCAYPSFWNYLFLFLSPSRDRSFLKVSAENNLTCIVHAPCGYITFSACLGSRTQWNADKGRPSEEGLKNHTFPIYSYNLFLLSEFLLSYISIFLMAKRYYYMNCIYGWKLVTCNRGGLLNKYRDLKKSLTCVQAIQ